MRRGKQAERKRQREIQKRFFDSLYLAAICDDNFCAGFAAAAAQPLHLLDERHALNHFAENNLKALVNIFNTGVSVVELGAGYMFAVQPPAWRSSEEKLAAVCVWPGIGHGQQSWGLQPRVIS